MVGAADQSPMGTLARLVHAVNAHDLDGLVACFATDYINETPAHPQTRFPRQRAGPQQLVSDLRWRARHPGTDPAQHRRR